MAGIERSSITLPGLASSESVSVCDADAGGACLPASFRLLGSVCGTEDKSLVHALSILFRLFLNSYLFDEYIPKPCSDERTRGAEDTWGKIWVFHKNIPREILRVPRRSVRQRSANERPT